MKQVTKRITALVLSLAMLLTLGGTAWAEELTQPTTEPEVCWEAEQEEVLSPAAEQEEQEMSEAAVSEEPQEQTEEDTEETVEPPTTAEEAVSQPADAPQSDPQPTDTTVPVIQTAASTCGGAGHKLVPFQTVSATCEDWGYINYKCSVCGYTEKEYRDKSLGHIYKAGSDGKKKTCQRCGDVRDMEKLTIKANVTDGNNSVPLNPAVKHNGYYDSQTTWFRFTPKKTGVVYVFRFSGKDVDNDSIYLSIFDEMQEFVDRVDTLTAGKTYLLRVDNDTPAKAATLSIQPLCTTHQYVTMKEYPPTCREEGCIISICTVCGKEQVLDGDILPELGHDFRRNEKNFSCTRCKEYYLLPEAALVLGENQLTVPVCRDVSPHPDDYELIEPRVYSFTAEQAGDYRFKAISATGNFSASIFNEAFQYRHGFNISPDGPYDDWEEAARQGFISLAAGETCYLTVVHYKDSSLSAIIEVSRCCDEHDFEIEYETNLDCELENYYIKACRVCGYIEDGTLGTTAHQLERDPETGDYHCKNCKYGTIPNPDSLPLLTMGRIHLEDSYRLSYAAYTPKATGDYVFRGGLTICAYDGDMKKLAPVSLEQVDDTANYVFRLEAGQRYVFTFAVWELSQGNNIGQFTKAIPCADTHTPVTQTSWDATCTQCGLVGGTVCSECGMTLKEPTILPKKAHTYTQKVIAPTCAAQGYTLNTCKNCGYQLKNAYTSKLAHTYTKKKVVAPTYAAKGYTLKTCSKCGASTKTNYTDKLTVSKVSLSSPKNTKGRKLTVKWKKNTKVTGYQVQYSTDKSFKKTVKTVTIKKNKTTSTTIKGLTKKKTYYVRIRGYKTVSKKNYYSAWSAAKSVKVKK